MLLYYSIHLCFCDQCLHQLTVIHLSLIFIHLQSISGNRDIWSLQASLSLKLLPASPWLSGVVPSSPISVIMLSIAINQIIGKMYTLTRWKLTWSSNRSTIHPVGKAKASNSCRNISIKTANADLRYFSVNQSGGQIDRLGFPSIKSHVHMLSYRPFVFIPQYRQW